MGQASSMGSLLLTAGDKGNRMSLPNARVCLKHRTYYFVKIFNRALL